MNTCANCGKEILEPNVGYGINPEAVCHCCVHDRRIAAPVRNYLTDLPMFASKEEMITMMQLREAPGDIITQVQMGKRFIVTKNGKPVAVIEKPEPTALELGSAIRHLGLME